MEYHIADQETKFQLLTFNETKIGSASAPPNHSSAVVAASSKYLFL